MKLWYNLLDPKASFSLSHSLSLQGPTSISTMPISAPKATQNMVSSPKDPFSLFEIGPGEITIRTQPHVCYPTLRTIVPVHRLFSHYSHSNPCRSDHNSFKSATFMLLSLWIDIMSSQSDRGKSEWGRQQNKSHVGSNLGSVPSCLSKGYGGASMERMWN